MQEDLTCHFLKDIKETRSHSPNFNTVILYDIENLTQGNSNPQFKFSLEDITERIKRYNLVNKIAAQYAYADWSNNKLKVIKPNIQQLGIEPIQIFGFSNHKNAADIQLVIDAVELIHSKPSLEVFAIVSGDGGFSCLAKKLHEYGKIVIGCGYDNQTNDIFAAVCDYFIRLPASVQQNLDETTAKVEQGKNKKKNNYKFVLEYLRTNEPYQTALKQNGVCFSDVQKVFKEQISGFDYKKQGFSQFKKFLNSVIQGTKFKIVQSGSNNSIAKLKID
ncbi:MAG: NYN domain-containing protein [Rivularia sp. (in: cyanobacteria)]